MTKSGLAILAGGRGTRMDGLMRGLPKALAPIYSGRSLTELLVARAMKLGRPVSIVVDAENEARMREQVRSDGVHWIVDNGAGTGAALRTLLEQSNLDRHIVLNCDTLVPFDVFALLDAEPSRAPVHQHLTAKSSQNEGLIGLDSTGSEVLFWGEDGQNLKAPPPDLLPGSSTGVYEIDASTHGLLRPGTASLELEFLPDQVGRGRVTSQLHLSDRPTYDFGTKSRYRSLAEDVVLRNRLLRDMGLLWN